MNDGLKDRPKFNVNKILHLCKAICYLIRFKMLNKNYIITRTTFW